MFTTTRQQAPVSNECNAEFVFAHGEKLSGQRPRILWSVRTRDRSSVRLNVLALVHDAALHHELHVLYRRNVLHRIPWHRNHVRQVSWL